MPTLQAVTPGCEGLYLHMPRQGSAKVPVQSCVEVQVEDGPQGALLPTVQVVNGGVTMEVVHPPPQLDVFLFMSVFCESRLALGWDISRVCK